MSDPAAEKPLSPQQAHNTPAGTGLALSGLGVLGWFVLFVLILSVPKESYTGDGQRDLVIGFGNFFAYLFQVLIGLAGMSIAGTLSVTGTVISATAISQDRSQKSILGLVLGLLGIALGVGLVVYRMNAWGMFNG